MAVETKSPESRERDEILRKAYDVSGWKGFQRKVLEFELERKNEASAYSVAGGYTTAGDYDAAFKWLQKAYDNKEAPMVWLKTEAAFDDLRSHPEFQDLLRRMRLEP